MDSCPAKIPLKRPDTYATSMHSFGRSKSPFNPLSHTQMKNTMDNVHIGILVITSFAMCSCGSLCVSRILNNLHTQIEVTSPPPCIIIIHSAGSDEPEDPVDFSSKPKSSATSFGS